VLNDTMRDSTGAVAPIQVVAFDKKGDSIAARIDFLTLDRGAHFDSALMVGDSAPTSVRIVASTEALQTRAVTVLVTLSPDTIVPADSTTRLATYSFANADSTATSSDLTTLVQHLLPAPSGVDGVIVHYAITRAPAENGHGPTVVLLNGVTPSERDTTSGGAAARQLRFRVNATSSSTGSDTAIVTATASYRGHPIGHVDFTVVFKGQ